MIRPGMAQLRGAMTADWTEGVGERGEEEWLQPSTRYSHAGVHCISYMLGHYWREPNTLKGGRSWGGNWRLVMSRACVIVCNHWVR